MKASDAAGSASGGLRNPRASSWSGTSKSPYMLAMRPSKFGTPARTPPWVVVMNRCGTRPRHCGTARRRPNSSTSAVTRRLVTTRTRRIRTGRTPTAGSLPGSGRVGNRPPHVDAILPQVLRQVVLLGHQLRNGLRGEGDEHHDRAGTSRPQRLGHLADAIGRIDAGKDEAVGRGIVAGHGEIEPRVVGIRVQYGRAVGLTDEMGPDRAKQSFQHGVPLYDAEGRLEAHRGGGTRVGDVRDGLS